jgi:CDP-diacylglycerol--glycerol-3-phosphate 3-phosphatidyltransferase
MTLANVITILRILLVPIFLVVLLTEMQGKEIIATAVFVIAAVSDNLDGYFARKYNQVTKLGKFLDPLADKLLIAAALLALVHLELVETWVAAVIILREIFITGFRFYFLAKGTVFSASYSAKIKTSLQYVAIVPIILCPKLPYQEIVFKIGTILLYITAFLTVYSGVEYVIKFLKKAQKENNSK